MSQNKYYDTVFYVRDTAYLELLDNGENCSYKTFILDISKSKYYRKISSNYRGFLEKLNIDSAMKDYYYPKEFIRQIEKYNILCKSKTDFTDFPKNWQNLCVFKDSIFVQSEKYSPRGLKYKDGYFFEDIGWMIGVLPIKILSVKKMNRFQHEIITVTTGYDSVMYYNTEVVTMIDTIKKVYAWGKDMIRTPTDCLHNFPGIFSDDTCMDPVIGSRFRPTNYIDIKVSEIETLLRSEKK